MMSKDQFWEVIEKSRELVGDGDANEQAEIVQRLLEAMEPKEIADFDRIYDELRVESYDNQLWAAAYIINGGCSDDGFEYFRGWLISRGRQVFERAVADPASLVTELSDEDGDLECEDMLSVARAAYEKKTGSKMPDRQRLEWKLKGDDWDEDTVDDLFPELAKAANARWK